MVGVFQLKFTYVLSLVKVHFINNFVYMQVSVNSLLHSRKKITFGPLVRV